MRFTKKGKEVDEKIKKQLDIVVDEIVKNVGDVKSILLYGGFGRGEGSVKVVNGDVIPANDYDVYVVTEREVEDDVLDGIAKRVAKRLGVEGIDFYSFDKEQSIKDNFYLDLKCLTLSKLKKLFPMIRYYELKNSSVLYGEDVRGLIPDYKVSDIPLSEGARLLLNRMTHLVEYFYEGADKEMLSYFCCKMYFASCSALLLLNKKFVPSYEGRMKIFKKCYKKDFFELYERIPDLSEKIEKYTKWKLKFEGLPEKDVKKFWFMARKDGLEICKYFFGRFLNKRIKSLDDFSFAIRNMWLKYYYKYVYFYLRGKGIKSKILSFFGCCVLGFYFNYLYFLRLKRFKGFYFRCLFNLRGADLIIFSAMPYILFSYGKRIDKEMLMKGVNILRKVYPVKGKNWYEISKDYADAYVLFFLQKIV